MEASRKQAKFHFILIKFNSVNLFMYLASVKQGQLQPNTEYYTIK